MNSSVRKSEQQPVIKVNPISRIFYWWTKEIFRKGLKGSLNLRDLYGPSHKDKASNLGNRLEEQWEKQMNETLDTKKQPSFFQAIILTFLRDYILTCLMELVELIVTLSIPLILGKLLNNLKNESSQSDVLSYAGALVFMDLLKHTMHSHQVKQCFRLGSRMRIAICSLIYRKALILETSALNEISPSKILNFIANDVNRFEFFIRNSVQIWSTSLTIPLIIYILFLNDSYYSIIGVFTIIATIPIQLYSGIKSVKYRLKAIKISDERVRLIDEVISGIQVIKMYTWEKSFSTLVEKLRKIEINLMKKNSYFRDFWLMLNLFTSRFALYFTLIMTVKYGSKLSAQEVFVVIPLFYILSEKTIDSTRGLSDLKDFFSTIKRIQSYLLLPEFSKDKYYSNYVFGRKQSDGSHKDNNWLITLENITTTWGKNSSDNILKNVNLTFEKGKLYVIIGMLGSGKSSLLASILGEINKIGGHVKCEGKLSYGRQEAWIFGDTIRKNIIFNNEFDPKKYNRTIKVCCLKRDFKQLPKGDLTIVGEKGVLLSGGQKARINLARAVYRDADIYLLDDPLSAVDAHVGKYLFDECVVNYLNGKTRILVTHQIQYIKKADGIILIKGKNAQNYSSYEKFLDDFPIYDIIMSSDENISLQSMNFISNNNHTNVRGQRDSIVYDNEEDPIFTLPDEVPTDYIKGKSFLLKYYRLGSKLYLIIVTCLLFIVTQFSVSMNDTFVLYFTTAEENRSSLKNENSGYTTETYIYIYTALISMIFLSGIARSSSYISLSLQSSKKLHNKSFDSLLNTSIRFFQINSSGQILNRFSKDTAAIDELLPRAMLEALHIFFLAIGAILVSCAVNPFVIIPAIIIICICYWIKNLSLKTIRILSQLEGKTRSSIFTYLNETLEGIITIRAHGAEECLKEEFDHFQNLHTTVWHSFLSCQLAISLIIKFFTWMFLAIITFTFVLFREHFSNGQVGLVVTQIFCMGAYVSYGSTLSSESVNHMNAIARLFDYIKLSPENKEYDLLNSGVINSLNWPKNGNVEFHNVSLRYTEEEEPVLKNLNFSIQSDEKIGIVGRTGAGKTSIISALFRLVEIKGSILIDGLDISTLSLKKLRNNISIIPQNPVLFSGTIRQNLDPFNEYQDEDIWSALEEVKLKKVIASQDSGLNCQVLEKGSNYSLGQRQLVCLARAILRKNRILVLDEATANVDLQTDALIQNTIRTKFTNCTVFTIAHRLNTIIDSNRVMVMDNGHLVEFDHSFNLLQNKDSKFTALVRETGDDMFQKLYELSRQCYDKIKL